MIAQFVIPAIGNLICYALLIWEVTKMVQSERGKYKVKYSVKYSVKFSITLI